jgi:hypothetical protein
MSFVLFLSIIAMTTAIVGCAAIWGFDVARAREVERDVAETAEQQRLQALAGRATPGELGAR